MKQMKRLLIILMCFVLVVMNPLDAYALSKTAKGTSITRITRKDPNGTRWNITCSRGKVTCSVYKPDAPNGSELWFGCENCGSSDYVKIQNHRATVTHNISNHYNNIACIYAWYKKSSKSRFQVQNSCKVKITNGTAKFYSGAGKSEKEFLSSLNKVNKNVFKGAPAYIKASTLKSMKSRVKKIVKGCKSDEQKVKAIHDWICKNIQYDYSGVYNSPNIGPGNDIYKVYKNKRAVCGGYAQLMNAFLGIEGIPCVYILGYAGTDLESGKTYTDGHAWNAVYVGGKWKYIDACLDCTNKYYGRRDSRNVKGMPATYTYYEVSPELFGQTHLAMQVWYGYSCGGSYIAMDYDEESSIYKIVGKNKVYLYDVEGRTSDYTVWEDIKWKNKKYNVVGISQNAFKRSSKVKKIHLWDSYLNEKSVKNCLKNSSIKNIVLYKKYMLPDELTKVKKAFSQTNVGKKVRVSITDLAYN